MEVDMESVVRPLADKLCDAYENLGRHRSRIDALEQACRSLREQLQAAQAEIASLTAPAS